jgi:GAF domain-containing protein
MPAPSTPSDDEVTLTQMAASYYALAHESIHRLADATTQAQRDKRTIDSIRERLAEKDARIAELEAEISRYTASMVAGSEAA